VENVPLKKWVRDQSNKCKYNQIVQPVPRANEFAGLVDPPEANFDGIIPEDHFFSEYEESDLREIMDEQMTIVKALKKHGKSKHLANRMLIIFDDLVGSSLFSGRKNNPFKTLNTNHRHYSASILMVSQAYKEIPKTVCSN
jgi:hypothetical protein